MLFTIILRPLNVKTKCHYQVWLQLLCVFCSAQAFYFHALNKWNGRYIILSWNLWREQQRNKSLAGIQAHHKFINGPSDFPSCSQNRKYMNKYKTFNESVCQAALSYRLFHFQKLFPRSENSPIQLAITAQSKALGTSQRELNQMIRDNETAQSQKTFPENNKEHQHWLLCARLNPPPPCSTMVLNPTIAEDIKLYTIPVSQMVVDYCILYFIFRSIRFSHS